MNRKFHVDINMPGNPGEPVLTARRITLRNRFLNALFGKEQQFVIILPGRMVESFSVKEVPDDSKSNG